MVRRPVDISFDELRRFVDVSPEAFAAPFNFEDDLSHFKWAYATAQQLSRHRPRAVARREARLGDGLHRGRRLDVAPLRSPLPLRRARRRAGDAAAALRPRRRGDVRLRRRAARPVHERARRRHHAGGALRSRLRPRPAPRRSLEDARPAPRERALPQHRRHRLSVRRRREAALAPRSADHPRHRAHRARRCSASSRRTTCPAACWPRPSARTWWRTGSRPTSPAAGEAGRAPRRATRKPTRRGSSTCAASATWAGRAAATPSGHHRSPQGDRNLAAMHFESGRYAEAEALYRDLITREPTDASLHTSLAGVLGAQERYDEAEAELKQGARDHAAQPRGVPQPGGDRAAQGRQRSRDRALSLRAARQPRLRAVGQRAAPAHRHRRAAPAAIVGRDAGRRHRRSGEHGGQARQLRSGDQAARPGRADGARAAARSSSTAPTSRI